MDARLAVIGDGELAEPLQALARELHIENHVLFCGWVLDRSRIFSDFDATCLSSHNEGSPVCLIESLAAGVPVIATRVGGVADVVSPRTDGELVEAGNDEAFCAAMLKVASGRQRISQARSKEVRNRYSIQRLVSDIEGIYEELLEGSEAVSGGTAIQMAWADRGK
jgi:glycosyltransferase involved in cell wall biosynthesis